MFFLDIPFYRTRFFGDAAKNQKPGPPAHEIFAGGKKVKMDDEVHSLLLRDDLVTTELQHDLDKLGIAKNSREEKKRARDLRRRRTADFRPRVLSFL